MTPVLIDVDEGGLIIKPPLATARVA